MTDETTTTETSSEATEAKTESQAAPSTVVDLKSFIPDDLKDDPTLANIKDIPSLVKSHVSAQRMLGTRIPIPTKEASDEVKAEFYKKLETMPNVLSLPDESDPKAKEKMTAIYTKLGRPESPQGYQVDIPEGVSVNEDYLNDVKKLALDLGLTKSQFKALTDHEIAIVKESQEVMREIDASNRDFLVKTWGNAYDTNKAIAGDVLQKLIEKHPDQFAEMTDSDRINSPLILMLAAEMGRMSQETGTVGAREGISGAKTPEQAVQEIADIQSNKKHAYFNSRDPGHEAAVAKMNQLFKDAYPVHKE
jgi:hypothetical protein